MDLAKIERMLDNFQTHSFRWTSFWLCVAALGAGLLSSAQGAKSLSLAWDQNAESDIAGYRLKYGTVTGTYVQTIDTGIVTTATVSNLEAGTTYFVVVTAYNTAGLESLPSAEGAFVTASNQAPTVSLTGPVAGTSSEAPANLTLTAEAGDADGSISRVEFYSEGTKIGEDSIAPYSFAWNAVAAGTYLIKARAIDSDGLSAESASISVTITPAPVATPPSVGTFRYLPSGSFEFTLTGQTGLSNNVYVSSNMTDWALLTTLDNTTGTLVIADSAAASFDQRFYKVSSSAGVSDPIGFVKMRIASPVSSQSPAFSYIATALVNPVSYRGSVGSSGQRTITDPLAAWTDSQFNGANGEFYIEITSGPNAGVTTDIVATVAVSKTLTLDDDLSALLAGGEQYRIRRHRTLGDIFGMNNEAGLIGGATVSGADEIRVFNPVSQAFMTFYYKTGGFGGAGWRATSNAVTDASGTKLYPDQGLVIKCKAGNGSIVVASGAVKTGATVVPIGPKTNLVANVYPAGAMTLGSSGLHQNSDTMGLAGGASVSTADEVRIFSGTAFRTYFYKTGGFGGIGWRETSDALADASTTLIPVGSSVFVIRKNDRPAFSWTVPQPF